MIVEDEYVPVLDELGFANADPHRRLERRERGPRDFDDVPRSSDDVYMLYTGGTTGMPKGVMWRHEDFFYACCLGGNPLDPIKEPDGDRAQRRRPAFRDEPARARPADARRRPVAHADRALRRATGRSCTASVASTRRKVLDLAVRENAHDDRHHRRRDGAPARGSRARRARIAGTCRRSSALGNGGAMLSAAVKAQLTRAFPNAMLNDSYGASETGAAGQRGRREHDARPTRVHDRRAHVGARPRHARTARTRIRARRAVRAPGPHPARVLEGPAKTAATFRTDAQRRALGRARRLGDDRRRRPHRVVRARLGLHQLGRREDLPRGGRSRDPRPSRRVRRGRRRRARRALRARRSWRSCSSATARPTSRSTRSRSTAVRRSRATRCRASCCSARRRARTRTSPTTRPRRRIAASRLA